MSFVENINAIEKKIQSTKTVTESEKIELDVQLIEVQMVEAADFFEGLRDQLNEKEVIDDQVIEDDLIEEKIAEEEKTKKDK